MIGLGRIGRSAARKASGFGMDVIGYDPYQPEDIFTEMNVKRVGFDKLLECSDCISIHAPLTTETNSMLSQSDFEKMKNDAIVVNTARGPIIDEAALAKAVKDQKLWGAGLDVFEVEPPNDTPAFSSDRIVVSPHNAGKSDQSEHRWSGRCGSGR